MAAYRECRKCHEKKDLSNFSKYGTLCIKCQKKPYLYKGNLDRVSITRKCLMCDKEFESYGNRKCDQCNNEYTDWTYGGSSYYLAT